MGLWFQSDCILIWKDARTWLAGPEPGALRFVNGDSFEGAWQDAKKEGEGVHDADRWWFTADCNRKKNWHSLTHLPCFARIASKSKKAILLAADLLDWILFPWSRDLNKPLRLSSSNSFSCSIDLLHTNVYSWDEPGNSLPLLARATAAQIHDEPTAEGASPLFWHLKTLFTGLWQGAEGRKFQGYFHDDFPMSGIYTDEAGVEFHVVFKARTPFSKIAEVGDAAFLTKMPLEVRSLCDRVGRRFWSNNEAECSGG
jgi:hypothetical protein